MLKFFNSQKIQLLIIVLFTFLAYSNIFQNGFVEDDRLFILTWAANKKITDIPAVIAGDSALSTKQSDERLTTYRPIRDTLYIVYYQIFQKNTFGWHLHSLLVHLGVTVLVFLIVEQLVNRLTVNNSQYLPFVAALMFGLHPIHTEAITFITSSMDMIGSLFFFAAFWLYIKSQSIEHSKRRRLLISSVIFATMAFLSYELTLVLPIFLMLFDWTFSKSGLIKLKPKVILEKFLVYIPYFATAGAYVFVRVFLMGRQPNNALYFLDGTIFNWSRFMEPEIVLKYLTISFLPINLSFNHVIRPGFDTFSTWVNDPKVFANYSLWPAIGALLLILTIIILALRFRAKFPFLTFGILWFFLAQLPFANIFEQLTLMAERYLYMASFGFLLVVLYFWSLIPRKIGILLMFLLIMFWGTLTYFRNFDWKNDIVLWKSVIRVYPKSALAYNNAGKEYFYIKDYDSAVSYFQKALELRPSYYYASYDLARTFHNLDKLDLAEQQYKKTLTINENYVFSYQGLAQVYRKLKRYGLAISTLEKALSVKRGNTLFTEEGFTLTQSDIHNAIGVVYKDDGQVREALNAFAVALKLDPRSPEARKNLQELVIDNPTLWKRQETEFGSFSYPPLWELEVKDEKYILISEDQRFRVEIKFSRFDQSVNTYLSNRDEYYGELVSEEYSNLPSFDKSYEKIWQDGKLHKFQLFLFKGKNVVEVLAYPSENTLKDIFDSIISRIEISD